MPTILAAARSSVTINGDTIEGLQSITYEIVKNQENVAAIGTDQRIDVSFGLKIVQGTLKVKSTSLILNELEKNNETFQIVANLKKELGMTGMTQTVTFDDCFIEDKDFGLDANGVAVTTYRFTATDVREE
jgi:translation elongation factor EF-1beta